MNQYILIWSVCTFVETRVQEKINLEELARQTGFSLAHIRDVFRASTGKSLSRYIQERKIANAAGDLLCTDKKIIDIAIQYGFSGRTVFSRVFRRYTGYSPSQFRAAEPALTRIRPCAGVFGIGLPENQPQKPAIAANNTKARKIMENNHSAILYGVPRVAYGQDGCTPFPMCILSCARYLGIPVDYARAMAESGAAFRLVWDTSCWNGGNVDAILSFDSSDQIFLCGMRAMERDLKILKRTPDPKQDLAHFPNCPQVKQRMPGTSKSPSVQKEDFMAFIRNEIDQGNPVIALGIIGPPEACVIAGYRENGNLLLGWNVFQEYPEYRASVTFDKNGYFITGDWWENPETIALIATGTKPLLPFSLKEVLANATEALRGRMCGTYAKGTLAYDAWKNALLCDRDFPRDAVFPVLVERMMCHGDAMDCLSDGRMNAAKYLRQMAEQYPLQAPGLKKAAAEFEQITKILWEEMIPVLGGWERGEKQIRQLARPETRRLFAAQIERMKTHDERALSCLHQLAEAE